jgi:hypothetical protein
VADDIIIESSEIRALRKAVEVGGIVKFVEWGKSVMKAETPKPTTRKPRAAAPAPAVEAPVEQAPAPDAPIEGQPPASDY